MVQPAYELNVPAFTAAGRAEIAPFAVIDAPNVIAEAVKPAEDGSDAFVLRLYESEGTKTATTVRFGVPVSVVERTDFLEDVQETLTTEDGALRLTFRPFQIITVKCARGE